MKSESPIKLCCNCKFYEYNVNNYPCKSCKILFDWAKKEHWRKE